METKITVEQAIDLALKHNLKRGKSKLEALHIAAGFLNGRWLKDEGYKIACHKGCGTCCHQVVAVGGFEAQHIYEWVCRQPAKERATILDRAKVRAAEFEDWARERDGLDWLKQGFRLKIRRREDVEEALKLIHEVALAYQEPCLFLDEQGACSVYPARPMVCRTTRSQTVCETIPKGSVLRSPFDQVLEYRVAMVEEIPWRYHEGRNWLPLPIAMAFTVDEWN